MKEKIPSKEMLVVVGRWASGIFEIRLVNAESMFATKLLKQ